MKRANSARGDIVARVIPNLIAFIASGCIMTLELTASRIIAKHLGASLYTWTAVIGVVLGGITVGNFAGGWLADIPRPRRTLAIIFAAAALGAASIPLLNDLVGSWDWYGAAEISWSVRIFIHVTAVFLLPSTILGLIGPVVAKMALDAGRTVGRTIGNVYAFGALGSIAGTFITGYFLISAFGTMAVTVGVALVLAIMALSMTPRHVRLPAFTVGITILLLLKGGSLFALTFLQPEASEDIVYSDESQYAYIQVQENPGSSFRSLVLDYLVHSYVDLNDPWSLHYDYENIYKAVLYRSAAGLPSVSSLFIGGGGFVFPRYIRTFFPGHVEVAEIDPAVTQASIAAFGLDPEDVKIVESIDEITSDEDVIWVRNVDARNHIEDLVRRKRAGQQIAFDYVFGDAFNDFSVPFHLTTREFNEKIAEILKPDSGVYMLNVIDIFHSGKFIGSIVNTLEQTFPYVAVFSSVIDGPNRDPGGRDTFVIVASLRQLPLDDLPGEGEYLSFDGAKLSQAGVDGRKRKADSFVLTDDHAPVEQFLASVVNRR